MADRTVKVRLEAAIAGYQAAMARAKGSTQEFGREVSKASKESKEAMQTLGTAFAVTGAVISSAMVMSGKAAVDFESSFAGVRKTVTGTPADLDRLASGFRGLSREIPSSIHEINAVGEAAGQLGIETANIEGFTRTMLDLGETTNLSATEAATQLARLANITQLPQTEFDRLGSTVVALGNSFATTEAEIVSMSLRLSGAGAQIGMSEADILSFATALSSVGIEAEAGGSAISKVMVEIASSVENGGDQLERFASVAGMSSAQFVDAFEQDATGAVVAFIQGLGQVEEQGGSTLGTLADLGIEEIRMRDALLRTAGAGELLADTIEVGSRAWEDNSALTAEAAQRYATTSAKVEIARNALNDAGITIGQTFTPAVGMAADAVAGLAGTVADLPGPAATAVGAVGSLAGAASLAAGGFLLAAPRIVETKAALATLATTMPRATTALSAMGSVLTGPWGIAALGAVTVLGAYSASQQESRQRVEELTGALDQQTGAWTENADAIIRKQIVDRELDDLASVLGISLADLTAALRGEERALREVNAVVDSHTYAAQQAANAAGEQHDITMRQALSASVLSAAMGSLTAETSEATEAARQNAEVAAESEGRYADLEHAMSAGLSPTMAAVVMAQQRLADETSTTGGVIDEYGNVVVDAAGDQEGLTGEIEETISTMQRYADVLQATFDPVFAATKAHSDLEQALADLAEKQSDSETSAEDLADAERNVAEQAVGYRSALAGLVDEHGNLTVSADEARDQMARLGLPPEVVSRILSDLGLITDDLLDIAAADPLVTVNVDTALAMARLNEFRRTLASVTGTPLRIPELSNRPTSSVPASVPVVKNHDGGWAGSGPAHRGPLAPDEIPSVLQRGEFVLSRSMLAGLPRFHDGGPVDVSALSTIVSSAVGGTSSSVTSGIRQVENLLDRFERFEADRKAEMARADLIGQIGAGQNAVTTAATAEERAQAELQLADAVAAVAEHDRERAVAAAKVELADAEARLAAELRVAANRDEWEFGQMSARQQIAVLTTRLRSERRFTDEWVRMSELRQQLIEREAQEAIEAAEQIERAATDAADDAFDRLVGMLDDRRAVLADMERLEQDHAASIAQVHGDLAGTIADLEQTRRDQLSSGLPLDSRFGYDATTITDVLAGETDQLQAWADQLAELRSRGLDERVVDLLGLDDGPEALGQIAELLASTDDQLAALNAAALVREQAIGQQIADERHDQATQLGYDLAEATAAAQAELAGLQSDFLAGQQALSDQLAEIGHDQGMTLTEAIAEGMASGLPAIQSQVDAVIELMSAAAVAAAELAAVTAESNMATVETPGGTIAIPGNTWGEVIGNGGPSYVDNRRVGDVTLQVPSSWTPEQAKGWLQSEMAGMLGGTADTLTRTGPSR